jgi:hypothetical protein
VPFYPTNDRGHEAQERAVSKLTVRRFAETFFHFNVMTLSLVGAVICCKDTIASALIRLKMTYFGTTRDPAHQVRVCGGFAHFCGTLALLHENATPPLKNTSPASLTAALAPGAFQNLDRPSINFLAIRYQYESGKTANCGG